MKDLSIHTEFWLKQEQDLRDRMLAETDPIRKLVANQFFCGAFYQVKMLQNRTRCLLSTSSALHYDYIRQIEDHFCGVTQRHPL